MHTIVCFFSTFDSLLVLRLTLIRPDFVYASTVWNCISSTVAKILETIQQTFIHSCQYRLFIYDHVTYEDFLKFLKLLLSTTKDFI
jgi:hypothetical protein